MSMKKSWPYCTEGQLSKDGKSIVCERCGYPEATDEHAGISHLPFSKAHTFVPKKKNTMDELKPCPFCGSSAELQDADDGANFIECTNPMCAASTNLQYSLKDDGRPQLIERWNRRVGHGSCDACGADVILPNELCNECKGV